MVKLETREPEVKNFRSPEETRPFQDKGQVQIVTVAGQPVACATFEPGWRWSENVRPMAGTDLCEASHLGYCVSGRLRVTMSDGTQIDIGPGDAAAVPPGHDAEVLGDEACVMIDFGEVSEYAKGG